MYVKFSYINSTIGEDDDEDGNCGGESKEKDEGIESIESIESIWLRNRGTLSQHPSQLEKKTKPQLETEH